MVTPNTRNFKMNKIWNLLPGSLLLLCYIRISQNHFGYKRQMDLFYSNNWNFMYNRIWKSVNINETKTRMKSRLLPESLCQHFHASLLILWHDNSSCWHMSAFYACISPHSSQITRDSASGSTHPHNTQICPQTWPRKKQCHKKLLMELFWLRVHS